MEGSSSPKIAPVKENFLYYIAQYLSPMTTDSVPTAIKEWCLAQGLRPPRSKSSLRLFTNFAYVKDHLDSDLEELASNLGVSLSELRDFLIVNDLDRRVFSEN